MVRKFRNLYVSGNIIFNKYICMCECCIYLNISIQYNSYFDFYFEYYFYMILKSKNDDFYGLQV